VSEWVKSYRSFWEQSFNRLDLYVSRIQEQEEKKHVGKSKS
jgi:hypothetical protein